VPWGSLTVSGQVEDKDGHEGNEDAGCDDVDDIEERLALDDEVEGDVLVLTALRGVVRVDVLAGRAVDDFPFTVLCQGTRHKAWHGGLPPCPSSPAPPAPGLPVLDLGSSRPGGMGARVPNPQVLGCLHGRVLQCQGTLSPIQGAPLPQGMPERTSITREAFRVDDDPLHRVILAGLWVAICLQVHVDLQGTVCQ